MPHTRRFGNKKRGSRKSFGNQSPSLPFQDAFDGLLLGKEYEFLLDSPRLGENIDSIWMSGSRAYGMENENSDVDIRGFAIRTKRDILTGVDFGTYVNIETDTVIHSFDKYLGLLKKANPDIITVLGLSPESLGHLGYAGEIILENSDKFLTKQCANTFGGYALAQLNRLENAVGRNKGISEAKATLEKRSLEKALMSFSEAYSEFANGSARISVSDNDAPSVNIEAHDVDITQMNDMLARLSAVSKSYEKLNARNKKKDAKHLSKHMSHLVRLYRMGTEILSGHGVIADRRLAGDASFLVDIKNGKYTSDDGTHIDDEFFEIVESEQAEFDKARMLSNLPDRVDDALIDEILYSVNSIACSKS